MNSVYPLLVDLYNKNKNLLKKELKKTISLLFLFGLANGLIGYLLSDFGITLIAGENFSRDAISILQILFAGIVLFYVSSPLSWVLVTIDKYKFLPFIYLFVALLNVVLNITFIPSFYYYATAITTLLSEFILLVLLGYLVYKHLYKVK
jgi:O-antigen/teichoic acid export membrane protein